jgi:hypothetical protein
MLKETSKPVVTTSLIKNKSRKTVKRQSLYPRYFFVAMASLFIVFVTVGFGQDYQLIYAQHITLYWFDNIDGALLTAWLLVFFTQTILAAKGNFKFHRQLGQFSVVLGVLVWISIGIVIFHGNIGYPFLSNISAAVVMSLFLTMNLFGLFFTWGIIVRKKAAAHKRLLFLATLILVSAGFNRTLLYAGVDSAITSLQWIGVAKVSLSGKQSISALLLYDDLLLIPLFIYDYISMRRIHKVTLIASGCIIGVHIVIIMLWGLLT